MTHSRISCYSLKPFSCEFSIFLEKLISGACPSTPKKLAPPIEEEILSVLIKGPTLNTSINFSKKSACEIYFGFLPHGCTAWTMSTTSKNSLFCLFCKIWKARVMHFTMITDSVVENYDAARRLRSAILAVFGNVRRVQGRFTAFQVGNFSNVSSRVKTHRPFT